MTKFIRQDAHKFKRLSRTGWRKPKGWHSKMKNSFAGHRKMVSAGFRTAIAGRGLIDNLAIILVKSLDGLKSLDAKKHCIIIASAIGLKKKLEIIEEAKKKSLKILNFKNVDEYVKKKVSAREEAKKKKLEIKKKQEKEKKAKEDAKKSDEKKSEAKTEAKLEAKIETKPESKQEEKTPTPKDTERAEMEKVLTKR